MIIAIVWATPVRRGINTNQITAAAIIPATICQAFAFDMRFYLTNNYINKALIFWSEVWPKVRPAKASNSGTLATWYFFWNSSTALLVIAP